jgi:hypothetical protein
VQKLAQEALTKSPESATRKKQRLASEARRKAKSRKDASAAETKKRLATDQLRPSNNRDAETDAETKKRSHRPLANNIDGHIRQQPAQASSSGAPKLAGS